MKKWLKQQEVSQLYYSKHVKQPKVVKPTIETTPFHSIGIDLADAQSFADTHVPGKE